MSPEDLARQAESYIERSLGAESSLRGTLADEGLRLSGALERASNDLGYSKATEFSPWIPTLDLLGAKVALLSGGPLGLATRRYDEIWGFGRCGSNQHDQQREYHRFRIEYLAGPNLLELVRESWAWALPTVVDIWAMSLFGNLLVECGNGTIWRVQPETRRALHVTRVQEGLYPRFRDEAFRREWEAESRVDAARQALGDLGVGQCFALPSAPVGSREVSTDGMSIVSIREWLTRSGEEGRRNGERAP